LFAVGTPSFEPWHLVAHLRDAAGWSGEASLVPALVRHFADLFSRDNNRRPPRFTPGALEYMQRARWKGNVRELKNTVERLIIMTPGEVIDVDDLRDIVRVEPRGQAADGEKERPGTLREFETSGRRSWSASCARTAGTSDGRSHQQRSNLQSRTTASPETDG
jgi:DNA-binding NtrC family response regulator